MGDVFYTPEAIIKQGKNLSPATRLYFDRRSMSGQDITSCLKKQKEKVSERVAPIVTAYRGIRGKLAKELLEALEENRPAEITTRDITSFTADRSIAEKFARRVVGAGPRIIIRVKIPRESIVASYETEPLFEFEKEIIANVPKLTVQPKEIEIVS